mgnify:CR=1 FL=1
MKHFALALAMTASLATSATAATRDYVLKVDDDGGAPLLNVFGGKITTYRKLAEAALELIVKHFQGTSGPWTAGVALPGGDFPVDGQAGLIAGLRAQYPFLDDRWAGRLVRCYGTEAAQVLKGATAPADLGKDFGAGITARELDWAMHHEWVMCGDDFLWRRTRLGLQLTPHQRETVGNYIASALPRQSNAQPREIG